MPTLVVRPFSQNRAANAIICCSLYPSNKVLIPRSSKLRIFLAWAFWWSVCMSPRNTIVLGWVPVVSPRACWAAHNETIAAAYSPTVFTLRTGVVRDPVALCFFVRRRRERPATCVCRKVMNFFSVTRLPSLNWRSAHQAWSKNTCQRSKPAQQTAREMGERT
ncbi:hypothetical protein K402DRAFT_126701 [Aulographum hederae CBS 113979]|uniref:Uncharacterized protein n=1 Tax=Aulographum hederae CBS 113979 TaxID=1176131 RepID=A0A6G1HEK0_9PEZI|nr:hypothetical protein K402DRAFT_126701 [Aulographum hederae CBS 113979]